MSEVRNAKFDVLLIAAPRLEYWPSPGVRAISSLCAEVGLTVGHFGGEKMSVKGVIPLPETGGLVMIQDLQSRIHRIHSRSVVKITPPDHLPDPFTGWYSKGLIPISTAEILVRESRRLWHPRTAILGTGNRALRFGSSLIDLGAKGVFCVEPQSHWGAKKFSGWEVEKRRFEEKGGRILEGTPLKLTPLSPLLWQFRVHDTRGVRVIDVGCVVSSGPFENHSTIKEHPPGSFLFELIQTSQAIYEQNVEGWDLEETSGRNLGAKLAKALVYDLGDHRLELEQVTRNEKRRLKRHFRHQEDPFSLNFEGKWMVQEDAKKLRSFGGVPKDLHKKRLVASIECIEEISCRICQTVCPTSAIQVTHSARKRNEILREEACISCGKCLVACPSQAISMIQEQAEKSSSTIVLPWTGEKNWSQGEVATLLNRKGAQLGTTRIARTFPMEGCGTSSSTQLIQMEIGTHLLWDTRAIRPTKKIGDPIDPLHSSKDLVEADSANVEITVNGDRRFVKDRLLLTQTLFELGENRPTDSLLCPDGTCGLCHLSVDSVKKLACQTRVRKGMAIKLPSEISMPSAENNFLCPCLNITSETVIEKLKQGRLQSAEAVLSATHVGEGKCHGQICGAAFKRLLAAHGLPMEQWIDWRFPWSDWTLI